jgi:hypothetical protein
MWSKAVSPSKLSLNEAQRAAQQMNLAGHKDWRVPTIKELYSLIDFRGYTGFSGRRSLEGVPSNAIPFINTDYFDFLYGATGERYESIDGERHYLESQSGVDIEQVINRLESLGVEVRERSLN